MGKGGYERRRVQQKKAQERERRRRQQQRRRWTIGAVVGVLVLLVLLAATPRGDGRYGFAVFAREGFFGASDAEPTPGASFSPLPTPTDCTTPGPDTRGKKTFDKQPCMTIDTSKTYTAVFQTSKGSIEVRLLDDAAPITVNNFVFLARQGYYDGTPFHRVLPDFGGDGVDMVQGGDAVNRNGTGGPGYEFGDENMIPFDKPGYLAMANAGPGTNGSQFFFLDGPVTHLNAPGTCPGQGCHSVFGVVTEGMEVIGEIASIPLADPNSGTPRNPETLQKVTIRES